MNVVVEPGDPRDPAATALLQASHALMQALFPAESNHYLSIDDLTQSNIAFFIAHADDQTLGCVALAGMGDYGEIKSMFVSPDARGTGTGSALLVRAEAEARDRNLPFLRLETGPELDAAIRLYKREGFETCLPFGNYPDDPLSLFMEKRLT